MNMKRNEAAKKMAAAMIDRHVAARLRAARVQAGRSQEDAGTHLGVTFQQLQKYEKGTNRVSAGKLTMLARLYGRPIEWFFQDAPGEGSGPFRQRDVAALILAEPAGVRLVEFYLRIPHDAGRRAVAGVAAAFAGQEAAGG